MKKRITAIVLLLAMAVSMLAGCATKTPENSGSDKKVNVKFILVTEEEEELTYEKEVTEGATYREALYEAGMISEDTLYAFFIEEIDGHKALAEEGFLWLFCDKDGNQIQGTADENKIKADDIIRIQYTIAPNFDD